VIVDHRDVAAALRRLAVPDGLAMIADQLLGVVDTIAIGLLGADALAAISAASSVFLTFGIAVFAFATGPRILGAQAIGAGDARRFGAIVRSAVVVPLGIAVLVALASLAGARRLPDPALRIARADGRHGHSDRGIRRGR
jgi:Na+-driven multidrug efflux pump